MTAHKTEYRLHPLNRRPWSVPASVVLVKSGSRSYRSLLRRVGVSERQARRFSTDGSEWGQQGLLRWRTPLRVKPSPARPHKRLLRQFAKLSSAPAGAFLGFAQIYGPLGVEQVTVMDEPASGSLRLAKEPEESVGVPLPRNYLPGQALLEDVALWRGWAHRADAMLRIASSLQAGQVTEPEAWRAFEVDTREHAEAWVPTASDHAGRNLRRQHQLTVAEQRSLLTRFINSWLRLADVRPVVHLGVQRDEIWLSSGTSLFGALAFQMADMTTRNALPYFCSNCGEDYDPKRKPAWDRRNYCQKSRCQASRKSASRLAVAARTSS